ncbi:MAG: hypothetical protein ACMUIG_09175 [Thermoplasmatota archaeon]
MRKCPKCGWNMEKTGEDRILPDPEFSEMSDGDLLDFFSEEITGSYDKYGTTRITYRCFRCERDFHFRKK